MKLDDISPYRLTIIGALVVLCLSVAVVTLLGGPQTAAPYLSLIGSIAIPALLGLFRSESNAKQVSALQIQQQTQHEENTANIQQLADTLAKKGGT